MVLWLRYLTEIDEKTRKAPEELLANPETRKALDIVEESAYTDAQMAGYDHFWEAVSWERTLVSTALKRSEQAQKKGYEAGMEEGLEKGMEKGMEKGIKQGMEEGIKQGKEQGVRENSLNVARKLKEMGMSLDDIMRATGLSRDDIMKA